MSKAGPVDILINNAGISKCAEFSEADPNDFDVNYSYLKLNRSRVINERNLKGNDESQLLRRSLLHQVSR